MKMPGEDTQRSRPHDSRNNEERAADKGPWSVASEHEKLRR